MPDVLVRRCRPLLGTFVEVSVGSGDQAAIDLAFSAIERVQRAASFHDEASDLARLRRAPAGTPVQVAADTFAILQFAAELHEMSGGIFDVTVAAALVADGLLPVPLDVEMGGLLGGACDIELTGDNLVTCRRSLLIDLGGIAKGYAVDAAADALSAAGVTAAIVNAGGDLRVLGSEPHEILIRQHDGGACATVLLADGAFATSSTPRGGTAALLHRWGARQPMIAGQTVSVAADRCVTADALTKIAMADKWIAHKLCRRLNATIVYPAARAEAA